MVLRIRAKLSRPVLNITGYKRALARNASDTIIQAALTWIATAVAIVPVWSGASRATFEKLASEISFSLDNTTPKGAAPDRQSQGRAESEGDVELNANTGFFKFLYATSLEHLIFNEVSNANEGGDPKVFSRLLKPGPYNFVEQANNAATPVFEGFLIPRLDSFITSVRVRNG